MPEISRPDVTDATRLAATFEERRMDLIWLGGFAALCVAMGGMVWACERWLATRPVSRH